MLIKIQWKYHSETNNVYLHMYLIMHLWYLVHKHKVFAYIRSCTPRYVTVNMEIFAVWRINVINVALNVRTFPYVKILNKKHINTCSRIETIYRLRENVHTRK